MAKKEKERCSWCLKDDIYKNYHDTVWGRPEHDDRALFAKLILDGAQAGLSWYTILIRTESYAKAYHNWDAKKIAKYGEKDVQRLMNDAGIIRNRSKIMEDGPGSFDRFLWKHVGGKTIVNQWKAGGGFLTSTPESDAMSKDLKKHGFKFVGTTIVYAFMQACGMVDDHVPTCWRRTR